VQTNVNIEKTIRVIVHFPLKSDGSGNFTETSDCYGNNSQYSGYWLAEKFIERANYWLKNNQEMSQQLSYKPSIPVNNINIQFKLAGVIFHRNDNLFSSWDISDIDDYVSSENRDVAINLFLFPNGWENGASWYGYDVCWVNGTIKAYNDYLIYGNFGIDNGFVLNAIHEIGHCLELRHAKRYGYGDCCVDDNPECLDNCDDTPTYLELLNDGYLDPCIWNGEGHSNNIMDYSPDQQAWTPCQIEIIHSTLENRQVLYPCNFKENALFITLNVSTENKSYIAKTVNIPVGSKITVSNNLGMFVNAEEFIINGELEIQTGSVLSVNTTPSCN
jgi:hypothetical protein